MSFFLVAKMAKRFFSSNEARMRIGRAVRRIPEEYENFFISKKVLNEEAIYDPGLKLFLHLNGTIEESSQSSSNDDKVLLVEGRREVEKFLTRLRLLLKWGHFYWRISDFSALKLVPQRVIKPEFFGAADGRDDVEMKIHWQMKVNGRAYFIKENVNLKSLYQVQYHRFFGNSELENDSTILYSGISRYVFSGTNGFCKEFHVERIEPKISKSKLDWRWRVACE